MNTEALNADVLDLISRSLDDTTFSPTTLNITTLIIIDLIATLSIKTLSLNIRCEYTAYQYADWFFTVVLSFAMPSVIMISVIML